MGAAGRRTRGELQIFAVIRNARGAAPVTSDDSVIERKRAMTMKADGKVMAILAADGFE